MKPARKETAVTVPEALAGQWIAWDRGQTRIIANGWTFDQAKQRAKLVGESSVILSKVRPRQLWSRFHSPLAYAVAVFISQIT